MKISITQLTLTDTTSEELVDIAATLGCDHVCLFPKVPIQSPLPLPQVQDVKAAKELRRRIDGHGLSVSNVEAFFCSPTIEPDSYAETLEIGAALGARRISCLNLHPDPAGAVDRLSVFSDLAAKFGLAVALEWSRRSETKTLQDAVALVQNVGRPNLGLVADVLHLMRNGGQPAELARVDPTIVRYAQINDGPLELAEDQQRHEAMFDRLYPGEGEFPLVDFVRALPPDAVLGIEAPAARLKDLPPLERARRAVDGTRRVLAASGRA